MVYCSANVGATAAAQASLQRPPPSPRSGRERFNRVRRDLRRRRRSPRTSPGPKKYGSALYPRGLPRARDGQELGLPQAKERGDTLCKAWPQHQSQAPRPKPISRKPVLRTLWSVVGSWLASTPPAAENDYSRKSVAFCIPSLGKVGTKSLSWRFKRNNEDKKERYVQSTRARGAGRMTEQELEHLRQVADRLMGANQEALEAIERMLVHEGEEGFGDDEAETAWEAEHLEATLVDVRDILGGASEDVRSLLEDSGE